MGAPQLCMCAVCAASSMTPLSATFTRPAKRVFALSWQTGLHADDIGEPG